MAKQFDNLNRFELGYLRAFEAVARLGHVRAAALELNLTPGAISQQLRKLQASLDVDLFERDGRRIRLTARGGELRRKLRPICSPALLNSADGLRSLADIIDQWLLHEDDGTEWRRWLSAAKVRRAPRHNAYFSTLMMAIAAALEGKGLALVSDLLAQDYLKSGRLVRPYSIGVEATRSYYCICPENRANELLIERFMGWITSTRQVEFALRGQD